MKSFKQFITEEDYKGEHKAPSKSAAAPLNDLTINGIYPKDVYSSNGLRYYGTGSNLDNKAYAIINSVKNKPESKVKMYRAVPHVKSKEERLGIINAAKKMWMKREKVHPAFERLNIPKKQYYDWLYDEAEKIEKEKEGKNKEITEINPGDWVTTVLGYAKEHGEANLNDEYKVLSKTVKAKELYTDGNSWLEWAYLPN